MDTTDLAFESNVKVKIEGLGVWIEHKCLRPFFLQKVIASGVLMSTWI